MEIFQTLLRAITTFNPELIRILVIPLMLLEGSVYMLLFSTIFQINRTRKQTITYIIIVFLIGLLSTTIIPNIASFINILLVPILIMIIFKTSLLKGFIANIFSLLIGSLISIMISKLYLVGFQISQDILLNVPIYRISYMLTVYTSMFIFYLIVNYLNLNIYLLDNMSKRNRNLLILNSILGLICVFTQYYLNLYYIDKLPLPIYVTILSIIVMLAYFFINIYSLTRTTKLEIVNQNLEESQLYNKSLKILHDNIRGFRHDFNNIVQSIGGYVNTEDIKGLKKYYSELLEDCQRVNNLAILSPDIINNPAIYSILASKYYEANEYGIKVNLEIFMDISSIKMKIYEFTRILGILLDNAIEAAKECDEKIINIEFRNDNRTNKQLAIIKNTYKNKNLNMSKIFEKGYSTKKYKKDHGLGLWEVNQILRKNNNKVELLTNKYDNFFVQQLEISIM